MAIQYYMRAFHVPSSKYVDWVVNDTPDSTGAFSGFPTVQLINITVNRIVQSKVANFLKPNQSLGGTDGEFFHVNSYDWKNAVSPIPPPTVLTGFAVERGVSAVTSITTATNASPIVVTSSTNHNLASGQLVTINGVTGNTNANGTWPIIVISPTSFSLTGSTGNGAYVSGGNIFTPADFSTLMWDETNNVWRLAFNTNGDGTTIGASQSLKVNNFILDGYIAIGPDPADIGAIRLSNNTYIFSEMNPPGADVQLIGADLNNRIKLGNLTTDNVYIPGFLDVDGYVQHDGSGSNTPSSGFIREQNNTSIVVYKNVNQAFSDVTTLSSNAFNQIVIGDTVNTGTVHNTSTSSFNITAATAASPVVITVSAPTTFITGQSVTINGITGTIGTDATNGLNGKSFSIVVVDTTHFSLTGSNGVGLVYTSGGTAATNNVHAFQEGGVTQVEIGTSVIRFAAGVTAPFLLQTTATGSNSGQNLTIQSQNAGLGGTNGGNLTITTGTGASNGLINLQTGGTTRITLSDTTETHLHQIITFGSAVASPTITQNSTTTAPTTLTISAQPTTQAATIGGALALSSGSGTSAAGNVNIQTAGTNQIIVSPTFITPGTTTSTGGSVVIRGSLEVVGTTTTVDSTVIDIIGRIIHANWADPVASPNVAVPSQVVGYSVHRGNSSGVPRDGAAWIWTEGALNSGADGYWRATTYPGDGIGTDNFTAANSLNPVGVLANDFVASSDPNPILGAIASIGSLRAANNVPVVVARNITLTTTIAAASNLATLPQGTINVASTTGFPTSGTLLIQSSTGTQTVTYTGTSGGTQFTGASGGTGTIITGGIVSLTNASTTFNGANGTLLSSGGTITVVSTTGFPPSGTLRIVSHTSNSATAPVSVQTVTYTGTSATTFTGVSTNGTGFLFVGDAFTCTPSPGTQDLVLLGTDFGNRILHGSPSNNTGHIFNTSTGFFYDFQVNSVSQFILGQAEIDADGYAEVLAVSPTINNPRLYQITQPNTGANAGFNFKINAQQGQAVAAGTNNNGGALVLASGAVGTGGTGGTNGQMQFFWGNTLELTLTDGSLQWSNLIGSSPLISQADGVTNGTVMTMQAQNGTATGGNLALTSGTGATIATAGNVKLQTGGVDRVVTYPTGSPANLPLGPSNTFYTEFRDTAQAVFIVPVSAGISSLGFASTVTGAQIAQVSTASTPSAPMTVQSQVTTAASGVGGNISLIAGNATGTTSTGGNAIVTSGTGTTVAGNVQLQTGAVDRIIVHPTFSEFRDTAEALRITPVSAGTTQITFAATDTAAQINQTQTASTPSAPMTIQSQVTTAASGVGGNITINGGNATGTTSTGGNAIITSGTGTTVAGNVQLQTGTTDRVVVHPTFTEFRDTAEAFRITPVSAGTTQLTFAATDTAVQINQTQTASTPSATMTIQSQVTTANSGVGGNLNVTAGNATGTTTTGGDLNLSSGSGTTTNGNLNLQAGGSTTARVHTNKFSFLKGWRRNITSVSTTYQALVTDDFIAATTSSAYTITMPATPTTGDTYTIKDASGGAGTNTLTISGNGINIDGTASIVLNQAYAAVTLTYTGSQWSVT